MTRRPVVNREELFSVADRMSAQGKQVTALSILAALGGGSLTTIYRYLEEWESLRGGVVKLKTASTPTPTELELPDVVQKAFLNVWKLATAEASREVVALQLEVEQLKEQMELSREQAVTWQKQRDAAVKEAAELRGRIKALTEQNSKLVAALAPRKRSKKD